jgi:hypothetical protein
MAVNEKDAHGNSANAAADFDATSHDRPDVGELTIRRPLARRTDWLYVLAAYAPFLTVALVFSAAWYFASWAMEEVADKDGRGERMAFSFLALAICLFGYMLAAIGKELLPEAWLKKLSCFGDKKPVEPPSKLLVFLGESPALALGCVGIAFWLGWLPFGHRQSDVLDRLLHLLMRDRKADGCMRILRLLNDTPFSLLNLAGVAGVACRILYCYSVWSGFRLSNTESARVASETKRRTCESAD